MRLWRWGRDCHQAGYRIFTLFYHHRTRTDCYLFHYPPGSWIPKHKDPAKWGPHYRFNITLKRPKSGGEFECQKVIWQWWRFCLFRADKYYHQVTPIDSGHRWVLSFGFTKWWEKSEAGSE